MMQSVYKIILISLMITLVGCSVDKIQEQTPPKVTIDDSSRHAEPDYLYLNEPDIDMIVYGLTAYVNGIDVAWGVDMNLEKKDEIGTIEAAYTVDTELLLTATKLEIGTVVYETEKHSVILVQVNGELVPYLEWVEG